MPAVPSRMPSWGTPMPAFRLRVVFLCSQGPHVKHVRAGLAAHIRNPGAVRRFIVWSAALAAGLLLSSPAAGADEPGNDRAIGLCLEMSASANASQPASGGFGTNVPFPACGDAVPDAEPRVFDPGIAPVQIGDGGFYSLTDPGVSFLAMDVTDAYRIVPLDPQAPFGARADFRLEIMPAPSFESGNGVPFPLCGLSLAF